MACCVGLSYYVSSGNISHVLAASYHISTTSSVGQMAEGVPSGDFQSSVATLFKGSCIQCHNATTLSGDLDLQRLLAASDKEAVGKCDLLNTVALKIQSGVMPPRKMPRPPQEQLTSAARWIHGACADQSGNGANSDAKISGAGDQPVSVVPLPPVSGIAAVSGDVFEEVVKPVIQNSCGKCHNPVAMKGELDLKRFLTMTSDQALKERDLWETIARRVEARQMPPEGERELDPHDVASISLWTKTELARLDEGSGRDPGHITTRRLNRDEYNNTVHDLLGVNINASADFPPDPYAYGFDDIGEALSLSPALTEMYMKTAQRIARTAIPTGPELSAVVMKYDAATIGQRNRMHIEIVHNIPVDAEYNVRAGWDQAVPRGTVMTGRLLVDGREVVNETFSFVYTMERAIAVLKFPLSQGPHKIEMVMEVAPNSQQPKPFRGTLPYPTWMEVAGPYDQVPYERTASFQRIFFKGPPRDGSRTTYAREILERLAYHAYRRPPTTLEINRLTSLTNIVRQNGGNFYKQIQIALEGILMSPDFLFRIEKEPAQNRTYRVNDYELASRLSYFLWSSMPDDELLSVAAKKELSNPGVLHSQVRRMLANPKASALAVNFSGQWLQTQNLEFETPDTNTFPDFDVELREAMQTETRMFFSSVMSEDRSILDFLNAKYTFLNERLAKFYGISGVTGPQFRRVSLEGTDRGGILTQASVLTATSYPTRTSPTVRGKWILTNILNTPPPEPPANVPSLASESTVGTILTIRERLNMHRANPVCASCHSGMDPLGFALEHYDAVGAWRQSADGVPVDASGKLPDGTAFTGATELQAVLMKQSGKFVNCLTEKLLTYGLGRGLTSSDRTTVSRIEGKVSESGYKFSSLIYAIIDSPAFQMKRPPGGKSTTQELNVISNNKAMPVHSIGEGAGHE